MTGNEARLGSSLPGLAGGRMDVHCNTLSSVLYIGNFSLKVIKGKVTRRHGIQKENYKRICS